MQIDWIISDTDVERIKSLIAAGSERELVLRRQRRNVDGQREAITRQSFWHALASMRLTSQQKSGPTSAVANFIATEPFPLAYGSIKGQVDRSSSIRSALRSHGGIRFADKIADELSRNFELLEQAEWPHVLAKCQSLRIDSSKEDEREIANYLAEKFAGIGPKQARNILQFLGLTRYEVPIDSRMIAWLKKFGFGVPLNANLLSDYSYYEFVLDGLQAFYRRCDVYPCILDAAIFALRDEKMSRTI